MMAVPEKIHSRPYVHDEIQKITENFILVSNVHRLSTGRCLSRASKIHLHTEPFGTGPGSTLAFLP